MPYLKKVLILILEKISRFIYKIIPIEFKSNKQNDLSELVYNYSLNEVFDNFKVHFKKSVLFNNSLTIRKYAINNALLNDKNSEFFYLEFGTYSGESANFFSQYVRKLYTFDSFEGLSNDWVGRLNRPKGFFNRKGKLPKLKLNVEPVVGWVEDTLDNFLNTHKPKINFVHFDLDTYGPTKFTLTRLKPYLLKNAILIFDDFYNYFGWDNGEFKALSEVFNESEFEYKAFDLSSKKCVIQLK
jgi:hypothetical protein